MNSALGEVWSHMRDLGLGALAHANRHAAYAADNDTWPELSVLQAAHAAELLIKARIAQEHPLLVFEKLPQSTKAPGRKLDVQDLFRHGRTLQWVDLPERLWAVTGNRMPNVKKFEKFGQLRNGLQHFAPSNAVDASAETLRFVFDVVDPFINECWELFAVDYDEDHEPYVYFVNALVQREILFRVSPDAAACFEYWDVDWSQVGSKYRDEMHTRALKAGAKV